MNMNPMKLLQMQEAFNRFKNNHPKFPLFVNAVMKEGIKEGTVIEITVTTPEGRNYNSNLKVTSDDLELIESLKQ